MEEKFVIGELIQQTGSASVEVSGQETPQGAFFCTAELPLRGVFYPLGYAVEILTNDAAVLEAANESFGRPYSRKTSAMLQVRIRVSDGGGSKCPREPARREYNHLFSLVADADNQALFDLKSCTCFIWLQKTTVDRRLYLRYNFLEKPVYVLLGSSVVSDLHAGCVSKNGKGLLLFGASGAGKSTLSYACARAGWTYTSDDTSYLINNSDVVRVMGHSHRVRFRPHARTLFPELEDRKLTPRLEGKPSIEVPTVELPGLVTASEASVHAVIYLNRSPSGMGRLVALPDGTAVQRAQKDLYSVGEIRTMQEKALEMLSRVPAYELQYCELDHAIDRLELLTRSL